MTQKTDVGRQFKGKASNILIFCLIGFLHLSVLPAKAIGANGDCPEGISAYWKLDETVTGTYLDDIGANDGTCTSCPGPTSGPIGNAQLFSGANTISVTANAGINWSAADSFTIELWMHRDTAAISGLEAFVGRAETSGLSWYIGINSSGNAQASLKDVNGNGPSPLTGTKVLTNASNTWHHVALVRNGTTNTLYVDGKVAASQTFNYTAGFASDTAELTMGALNGANHFNGRLDEVAIYNQPLDAKTIKGHYYIARHYCDFYETPISIMPLGDSITMGVYNYSVLPDANRVGYRLDLSDLLSSNLYTFDFIGSNKNGQGIDPFFDEDHAGFPGITDSQLFTLLATGVNEVPEPDVQITNGPYLEDYPAEIILLHIGTNALDTSPTDVESILDQIDLYNKNITTILARIIDQSPNNADVYTFNNNVEVMANNRIAQGDKIIMVDMEDGAGINYTIDATEPFTSGDMYNTAHPNAAGYTDMAGQWFTTLETLLPQSEVPVITSTALTEAVNGQLYTYTVSAKGPPTPTFALVTKPAGMTIDPVSGLIEWTPSAVGSEAVTVQALNWAGQDVQSFTISVNDLPQAVSDSYSDIMEGSTFTVSVAQGVLNNDTGGNGPLTAILVTDVTHGTLSLSSDGAFTYTHDGSDNLSDSFSYKATDGNNESAPVSVVLNIKSSGGDSTSSGGGGGEVVDVLLNLCSIQSDRRWLVPRRSPPNWVRSSNANPLSSQFVPTLFQRN